MKRSTKLFSVLSLLVLALLVFVPTAQAFDGRSGDRIVIGPDEVINDDLYLGANEVIIDGTVNGDVMAAGQSITVNGTISGDLWVAGRDVTVNGSIGDDLFAAAAAVTLGPQARITDDVFSAGASVETRSGSQIGGSLLIGASQGLVSGNVSEDLLAGTNRLRLEGVVGRNAKLGVNTPESAYFPNQVYYGPDLPAMPFVPAGLTFGSEAAIEGTLEYTSSRELSVPADIASKITFSLTPVDEQVRREISRQNGPDSEVFNAIRRLIALVLVGLLLARLFPALVLRPADRLQARPLPSFGFGLLALALFPAVVMVAFGLVVMLAILFGALTLGQLVGVVVVLGLPTILLGSIVFIVALGFLPQTAVAYLGGRWILSKVRPEWAENIYGALLTGLVLLGILIAVPVAGGLLQLLVILFGLGALILMRLDRPSQPVVATEVTAS